MDKLQDEILKLALQRGLITPEELRQLNRADPLGVLLKNRRLSNSTVESLKRELLMDEMNTIADPADRGLAR